MTKKRTSAVDINDIVCDERCQPRAILNPEAVEEYAEIYKEGEVDLPALEVCKVGDDLVLINGFHRLAGARQADHGFVRVTTVEQCDMGRAMWLAAAMNQGCGVRRSNKDKRRAVELALASDIGQEQSSRQIAEHIGVSKDLVRRMKEDWEAENKAKPEPGAGGFKATPPTDDDTPPTTTGAQEVPADVSDDEVNQDDEASPAPPLEAAQAIAEIADTASQLYGVVRKAHALAKDLSAGAFPEIEDLANDVTEAAKLWAERAAATVKEEESELPIAS